MFVSAPSAMVTKAFSHGRILLSSTRYQLAKRYSGSLFGKSWLALQPAILLGIYLFVYLVIFRMRFPGYSQWDYVLFVFCGLIPYIGFSEAVNAGCVSIRQNMHLVNNILMPVELLPVRSVLLSMVGQLISMGILLLLVLPTADRAFNSAGCRSCLPFSSSCCSALPGSYPRWACCCPTSATS